MHWFFLGLVNILQFTIVHFAFVLLIIYAISISSATVRKITVRPTNHYSPFQCSTILVVTTFFTMADQRSLSVAISGLMP